LARLAFLETLSPAERRDTIAGCERTAAAEIARLRAAPEPHGFRREVRRCVLARMEATRQWLRGLEAAPLPPAAGKGPVLKRK